MSETELYQAFFQAMKRTSLLLNESKRPIPAKPNPKNPLSKAHSKIGGAPCLPAEFEWPRYSTPATEHNAAVDSAPLTFVAQIDCQEVYEALGEETLLPRSGMLWFFYEMSDQRWGFDPADEGCARVIYADIPFDQLTPTPPPEDLEEEYRFQPYALTFEKEVSLPDYEEACDYLNFPEDGDDWDDYDEAKYEYLGVDYDEDEDYTMVNRLFGYANLIQGSMLEQCELTSTGVYTGRKWPEMTEDEKQSLKERAAEWQLLLQVAYSEKDDARMFGDCGNLYFYIRKEDLAACRFDKIWMVLQCG